MNSHANQWFGVDKEGLAKLIEKRGKAFALFELLQNAWDTDTKTVEVTLWKIPGKPQAKLIVIDDDPDGFHDLAHAYTLFAESVKKNDPTKRGRWNLGEKLVLALCKKASISSTKGTVVFGEDGTRKQLKTKTDRGSRFEAVIKMNQQEYDEVCREMQRLIPPEGIKTIFNGEQIKSPEVLASFETALQTVKSDEEGNLVRTIRKTKVNIHQAGIGWIYEMGIPVVETGDSFHVDVQQKVPVNMDRDNVPPSYLKTIRAHVLNETHNLLTDEQAQDGWVSNALEHEDIKKEAVEEIITKRFGEKRVVYDPSDREANHRAMAKGYTVIPARSFSREAWSNIKKNDVALPSGRVMPTPKPYSDDENAEPAKIVDEKKWTQGMKEVVELASWMAKKLLDVEYIEISIINEIGLGWSACYGPRSNGRGGRLDFNLARLGHSWFGLWSNHQEKVIKLLLHEFSHHYEQNHLSEGFADAGHLLGARLAMVALDEPEEFKKMMRK